MGNCAGIDWASEKHDLLIADDAGNALLGETFAHDERGITVLCDAMVCFEVEVVAISPGRRAGRTAAGGGGTGVGVASQPGQGGARQVPCLRREVRSV